MSAAYWVRRLSRRKPFLVEGRRQRSELFLPQTGVYRLPHFRRRPELSGGRTDLGVDEDAINHAIDIAVRHLCPTGQAEPSLEELGRDVPPDGATPPEHWLQVHRLPYRPRLDVERLEVEADILSRGAERHRVDLEDRQPSRGPTPGRLRHEREPGRLAKRFLVRREDSPSAFDAIAKHP